jgi:hypothetical protein
MKKKKRRVLKKKKKKLQKSNINILNQVKINRK